MILDIDIGNTNTKWRIIDQSRISLRGSQPTESLINGQDLDLSLVDRLTRARLCSVADKSIITALSRQLSSRFNIILEVAVVSDIACGVTCGYEEPATLGVDRWLAMIAAYARYQEALIVVDAGSAVTIDVLRADGYHLGGYILPGIALMRDALWSGTRQVKADLGENAFIDPAIDTEGAVNHGSLLSIIATIEKIVKTYPSRLILTGGSAEAILRHLNIESDFQPELVLDGLLIDGVVTIQALESA